MTSTPHTLRRRAAQALCLLAVVALVGCGGEDPPKPVESADRGNAAGQTQTAYELEGWSNPLARQIVPAAQPAPKPTGPLPPTASCITADCHANYATSHRLHQPLAFGRCDACHGPDTGDHKFPLARTGNALCTFCHQVADTQTHQHAAVADPGCLGCHRPHDGEVKFLLTHETPGELCLSCHNMPMKSFAHEPYLKNQCTVCHYPHQSMAKGLLRGGEGPAHCLSCHEDTKLRLVSSAVAHDPVLEDCTTCHHPHTSDGAALLAGPIRDNCISCHPQVGDEIQLAKMPHGAVTDDRSCANCHDPHASNVERLLTMRQTELCLTCHDKPIDAGNGRVVASVAADLKAPFLHGPVEAGDCAGCHDSHGGKHANLLHQPFPDSFYAPFDPKNYGVCFECHSPDLVTVEKTDRLTGFRDGDVNLHYVHVHKEDKGRTCKACHAIHGSSQPMHLAEAVPFEGSEWPLPIRFEKRPDGGSCSPGCHEPMDYDRNRPAAEKAPVLSRSVR